MDNFFTHWLKPYLIEHYQKEKRFSYVDNEEKNLKNVAATQMSHEISWWSGV